MKSAVFPTWFDWYEIEAKASNDRSRCRECGCDRGRGVQEPRLQDRPVAYVVAQEVAGLAEDRSRDEELSRPVRQQTYARS